MKKFIAVVSLVLMSASTLVLAQKTTAQQRQQSREAKRAQMKAEQQVENEVSYEEAVSALKNKQFVLEATQLIFRNGQSVYVTSTTNFVMMNNQHATVQIASNSSYPGLNGVGGVTVDGNASDMKITTDKKGNVNCSFSIQGISISAQIFISLTNGGNNATITVNPNFNSNTLTLNGNIVPLSQSTVYKGRATW